MPCRFDHSWQRAAVKAPSRIASRKLGHAALPGSRASSVSRSCTEAGTTATAGAIGINQGHALAPEHLLGGVVPPGTAHRKALDGLRVDDAQAGLGPAPHRSAASAGDILQEAGEPPPRPPLANPTLPRAPGAPRWAAAPATGRRCASATQSRARPPHRASPAHYAADLLAPASALSGRPRAATQSLSGAGHAARDAPRSTSFPSVKPRSSLRDQIGIRHTGPLKQALSLMGL